MITENKFKIMIKLRIKENALKYLLNRRGSKGQGMKYSMLEMSEYLLPNYGISNEENMLHMNQKYFMMNWTMEN